MAGIPSGRGPNRDDGWLEARFDVHGQDSAVGTPARHPRLATTCLAAVTGLVVVAMGVAAPAQAANRDGICDEYEFCYFYNSGNAGAVSDFTSAIADYGATQPQCYEFCGGGQGDGACVKNGAASVWNLTDQTVRVYHNSDYGGHYQDFAPGVKVNLDSTLKNDNASHQFFAPDQLLYNVETGKCADLPGLGEGRQDGPVNQFRCTRAGDNQLWRFVQVGKSQGLPEYLIENGTDGRCLDLPAFGAVQPGTPVTEHTCRRNDDNQVFLRKSTGISGYYLFINLRSNLCLGVAGIRSDSDPRTGADNARLILEICSADDDHTWAIRAPHDPYHADGSYELNSAGDDTGYVFGSEVDEGIAAARRYHIPPRLVVALLLQEHPGAEQSPAPVTSRGSGLWKVRQVRLTSGAWALAR